MLLPFFLAFLLSEVKLMKVLFTPFIKIFVLPYVAKKIFLIKLMCFEAYSIISVFLFKKRAKSYVSLFCVLAYSN